MMGDRFRKRKKGFQFNLEEVLTQERRGHENMEEPPEDPYSNPGAIVGLILIVTAVALLMMSPIGHAGWKALTIWLQTL